MNASKQVLVSVVIPNYNYGRYISEAIESVLAQTYPHFEIIVVNNGSTDDSLEILQEYRDRITLINQENRGQSEARNSGLRVAAGELIAFLDADDVWSPKKLESQISLISEKSQLIYCGIRMFESQSGAIIENFWPKYRGSCKELFVLNPGSAIVIGGESTVLITRDLLNKVGGFDPNFSTSGGWDFYRRCSLYTNFDFVDEILVNYRRHGSNASQSTQINIHDIRKSYLKLLFELTDVVGKKKFLKTYIIMEVRFLKTLLRKFSFKALLVSVLYFPFRIISFSLTLFRGESK